MSDSKDLLNIFRVEVNLLTATLSSMGDAVITTDDSGVITFLNPVAQEITGWSQESAYGMPLEVVFQIINEETREVIESPAAKVFRDNDVKLLEDHTLLVTKNGSERPIDDSAAPIRDLDGRTIGMVLIFRDASERRIKDRALAVSEKQYRRLFQSAKDGILVLDAMSLKIIDANQFIKDLIGYELDELLGKELWQIGFFNDKKASQAMYHELQELGYVRYEHLPLETKLGKSVEVEFISNVYLVDSRAVAQCNIRDISERSSMERKLQEQTESLADLHRRKDEFLAMLSHELRNPLAPIANAVHMLRLQKDEDPIQHRARSMIERQVAQLTRLVDDLMEVSRITTGQVRLRNEIVVINGIIEAAVGTVAPLIEERTQDLRVELSLEPILLNADAARLEQVAVNLLTNASKYTDEGGNIWVSVGLEEDECVIHVRDSGIGIAPELLPRIFDLFTQADKSLARSRGGLGIGLALVQSLVEMHGGRVGVYSVLGKGSEFIVWLPVANDKQRNMPRVVIEKKKKTVISLKIIIVDDNIDTADSLAILVEMMGHEVKTAYDGPEALALAAEYNPHIILMDIGLPTLSGYEVAIELRKQAMFKDTTLVAITGYGQESDRLLAADAGFNHHMIKPVNFDKVQEILDDVHKEQEVRNNGS